MAEASFRDAGIVDLLIIGGGINGAGIACDAAGRGLRVLLCEAADLASGTSSASSKLLHGGLRYLEHYEFRLVREALAEREVLLAKAPHIAWPLRFILPRVEGMRPAWLIRLGLFLYDNLYRRQAVPGSSAIGLGGPPFRPGIERGFAYWDCWADDARLVVLNAMAARDRGAEIRTRCRVVGGRRDAGFWRMRLRADDGGGGETEIRARAVVNAAGPWILSALEGMAGAGRPGHGVRLVKGSHIVVPRIDGADDALILQNADRRVVFVLPYEESFSLIGTTDVPFSGDASGAAIDAAETAYLLDVANGFLARRLTAADVVWSYSGVRALFDDGRDDPSAISRDYRLELDAADGRAPLLSVFGGKITTYRRLAEQAVDRLARFFPDLGGAWTAPAPLPGGDIGQAGFESFLSGLAARRPGFDPAFLRRLARRHGGLTESVLGDAHAVGDLGRHFGAGLYEREALYLRDREWARTPEDVLWRRTKVGLHLAESDRRTAEEGLARLL